MQQNQIESIRADILKYFDETAMQPDSEEIHFSPNKKYFFQSVCYRQADSTRNWVVSKIRVFRADTHTKIFEFIRNDDSLFHGWLTTEGQNYLLLSEALEGKSILDLSNGQFYSYSFQEDSFIWVEYYPSPHGTKLAVVGCYWAAPYEIIVFDTSHPTHYPYKEFYRQGTSSPEKLEWLDNDTLKITDNNYISKIVTIGN